MRFNTDLLKGTKVKKIIILTVITLSLIAVGITIGIVLSKSNQVKINYHSDSYTKIESLNGKNLPKLIKKGDKLSFRVVATNGYVVNSVLVDNQKIESENDIYTITIDNNKKSVGIFSSGRVANISNIAMSGELEHKIQYDGEVFDPSGLIFSRVFEDGSIKDLSSSFINFPVLKFGEPVQITYNSIILTIPEIEIKYSITFDLGSIARFKDTKSSILKIGYNGNDLNNVICPSEDDIEILNGQKTNAFKGWELKSGQKNLVYIPKWNYLDNITASILVQGNKPILTITSNILIYEKTDYLKIKIGDLESNCEVEDNKLVANVDLSLLGETASGIMGLKILVIINDNTSVSLPKDIELNTVSCGGYTYEIIKTEDSTLIKKITEYDYQIEYSKLELEENKLNIELNIFDYITNEKQNLNQGTTIEILIGDNYKIDAQMGEDLNTVKASFNLDNYNLTNLFETGKEYQIKAKIKFNTFIKILDIPFGATNVDNIIEYNGYYYSLTRSDDLTKTYIRSLKVPQPEININSVEVINNNDDYVLTIKGTIVNSNSIRLMLKTGDTSDYGEDVIITDNTFSCNYVLSNLQQAGSPVYDIYLIANNDIKYTKALTIDLYEGDLVFYTKIVNNQRKIYTFIKNIENNLLQVKAEQDTIKTIVKVTNIRILENIESKDYELVVSGTCENVESIYIIADTIKSNNAEIENNLFTLTYSLSNINSDGINKYFSLVINNDELNSEYLSYLGDNLESLYTLVIDETMIIKYNVLNINNYLVVMKELEELNEGMYSVTLMQVDDMILTIEGICENVNSIYIVCESDSNTYNGEEGINLYLDPTRFSCKISLKDIKTDINSIYKVYLVINSMKEQVENTFFVNEPHQYEEDNKIYKFILSGIKYLEIETSTEEILIPEYRLNSVSIEDNVTEVNLKLSGVAKNISNLSLLIYESNELVNEEIIDIINEEFSIIYNLNLMNDNQTYTFMININGENKNIDILPNEYMKDYDENNYLVFLSKIENGTLVITKVYVEKEDIKCNYLTGKIEYKEDKPYLKIDCEFKNVVSANLKSREYRGDIVQITDTKQELILDLTMLPIGEDCYIEIEYRDKDNNLYSNYVINSVNNTLIEAGTYEYYLEDSIIIYEVSLGDNEDFLLIKTSQRQEEFSYDISSIIIENDLQQLIVEGVCQDARSVQLQIGTIKGENGIIDDNQSTYKVIFDLRLLENDGMENTIIILFNNKGYMIKDDLVIDCYYEKEIEGAIYKTTLLKDVQNYIKIKREVDKTLVPDYEIESIDIEKNILYVIGSHTGLSNIKLVASDSKNNIIEYTSSEDEIENQTFKVSLDLTLLEPNQLYSFKLKIDNEYYSIINKGLTLENYKYEIDLTEYTFIVSQDNYGYLYITQTNKQIEQKEISILNMSISIENEKPYLIVKGQVTGYQEIYIKSSTKKGDNALITENEFQAMFNLELLDKENIFNYFSLIIDNEERELNNNEYNLYIPNETNLVYSVGDIENIYTVKINENTEGKLAIIYTKQQILESEYNIESMTFSDNKLKIKGTLKNVDSINLKIDTLVGIGSIDNNVFNIELDVRVLKIEGIYNVYIVVDGEEKVVENKEGNLYIENNTKSENIEDGYIYTYTILVNETTQDNLVLQVTKEIQKVEILTINNVFIENENDFYYLVVNGNTENIDTLQVKIGDKLGEKSLITSDSFEIKISLNDLVVQQNSEINILANDKEYTIRSDKFININETIEIKNDKIKQISFTNDSANNLRINVTERDKITPKASVTKIYLDNTTLEPKLILEGTCENVEQIELKVYMESLIEYQINIYALIESTTFKIEYVLGNLEINTYNFKLSYNSVDELETKSILYNMDSKQELNIKLNDEIHTYSIFKDSEENLILTYTKKPEPKVVFNAIYFSIIDNVPYLCLEVNLVNATQLEILTEKSNSELVENVYRVSLIDFEIDKEYKFTYKVDGMEEQGIINGNIINEGTIIEYTTKINDEDVNIIYTIVKKADNLLYVSVEKEK